MLAVAEALEQIISRCQAREAVRVALGVSALGGVLAEDVASDLDVPPFDKALMDGYAVRSADCTGPTRLTVVEEILAGRTPTVALSAGQASRIMTGAPLPVGADAVVVVEQTTFADGQVAFGTEVRAEQNLLRRGREMRTGERVLAAGTVVRPQELGVLATVGRTEVLQYPRPTVAILATGDELVEPPALPGPGQIRNSNVPMLAGQANRAGAAVTTLGIARDDVEELAAKIHQGLASADILVLIGGVSAGKRDLVPDVLRAEGVTAHFHKVRLKPGKPLLFGTHGHKLVFGLPGNPVSSFVCFELFLRPAIRFLAGHREVQLPKVQARLTGDFNHYSDRPTYHPARLESSDGAVRVTPVAWFGSADLRAFLSADALGVFPEGARAWKAGECVDVLKLDG